MSLKFEVKTTSGLDTDWTVNPNGGSFSGFPAGDTILMYLPGGHYEADEWVNITVTKKATGTGAMTAGDVKIYVNGNDFTAAPPSASWELADIPDPGAWNGVFYLYPGAGYTMGKMITDEAAAWDRQLTDEEVTAIYNAGGENGWEDLNSDSVGDTDEDLADGLIQYWRFGDGDSNKDGSGDPDTFEKIHDMSSNDDGIDLELYRYLGDAEDMIKDH
jgi:hypothetical protein